MYCLGYVIGVNGIEINIVEYFICIVSVLFVDSCEGGIILVLYLVVFIKVSLIMMNYVNGKSCYYLFFYLVFKIKL